MTEDSHGGTPADQSCYDAWAEFEELLAGHLATMVHGDDHLILELSGSDPTGSAPYAQFAGFGGGEMVRGEISSNTYLGVTFQLDEGQMLLLEDAGYELEHDDASSPRNWVSEESVRFAAALASRTAFALRHVFGIAHPHLLTYKSWGPAAEGVASLGLCPTDEVPVDLVPPDAERMRPLRKAAYRPRTRDKLVELVGRLLQAKYDGDATLDEDGDFVLSHMGQPVWVRVRADQPAVEIMARVAHDVRSRRGTSVEIGILNRDHAWVKWELVDRGIWQRVFVPGFPFAPAHLDGMLDVFLSAMTSTRDDLALRVGGRTS